MRTIIIVTKEEVEKNMKTPFWAFLFRQKKSISVIYEEWEEAFPWP